MPIREQSRRVPRNTPSQQHPRHAAGARSPGALKPARPAYLGLAKLDSRTASELEEKFALPVLAIALLVSYLLWLAAGTQPVTSFDRPGADAAVESSTVSGVTR